MGRESTLASLTVLKPLIVWITTNCGEFLRRWEYQITLPANTCLLGNLYVGQEATVRTGDGISSVQSLSHVQLFKTPWTAACQGSLSITNSRSLPKLMIIESVMPSNHLILCHPLLLPPSTFPSIRVFSNESVLHSR